MVVNLQWLSRWASCFLSCKMSKSHKIDQYVWWIHPPPGHKLVTLVNTDVPDYTGHFARIRHVQTVFHDIRRISVANSYEHCLSWTKLYLHVNHTYEAADDSTFAPADQNECQVDNGGCSHECVDQSMGFHCRCPDNMRLVGDTQCEGEWQLVGGFSSENWVWKICPDRQNTFFFKITNGRLQCCLDGGSVCVSL